MNETPYRFSDESPYPPVKVSGPSRQYAAMMLSNIGSCNSEMSAVSLYFYNSLITRTKFAQVADCFHRISIVEMHHMDIFGQLSLQLGLDPRLWSLQNNRFKYWSPSCNKYPDRLLPILQNALAGEQAAIRKYREQAACIQDCCITAILNRIILDEELHVAIFRDLIAQITAPEPC